MSIIPATRSTKRPDEPRRTLLQPRALKPTDHPGQVMRLLDLWARVQAMDAASGEGSDCERQLRLAVGGGSDAII